jgi:signal transduction histidine kinase
MKGKSDFDFYPEHMARQYYNDEQTLMKIGEPLLNHEEQVIDKKTGEIKWNLSSKVPVRDSEGQVIGLAGFNRDITIKKRTELENQVLYEISQGYTMSDNLENFLSLIHGSLSKIVYAENCFVALYDQNSGLFSFPYFVDKFDTVPLPTSMLKSCTAYVLRKGKPFLFSQDAFDHLVELNEVELVGSASPSWIGIPLHTHSQTIGVLVLQHYEKKNVYSEKDVKILMLIGRQIAIAIERKKAEEEIKIKNELLEAINIEKDKFFSIIAHDLRGPIGSFVTATQIIEDDLQNMTLDEIRDLTISMKTEATNLYRLLENLLEWSRLKRGVMEFSPARLNLLSEINSAIESVSELGRQKGIAISVSVRYELEITADKHMLQTIIRNLVANGVKFTRGGGKVTVTAMRNDDGSVEITVIDTGIGMTEDMKHRLFIMNEKTGRKGTDGEPSSGLGLLLCKEFVEKHKGKILVESEVDKGSSFKILIP